jgi:hypothetical protein
MSRCRPHITAMCSTKQDCVAVCKVSDRRLKPVSTSRSWRAMRQPEYQRTAHKVLFQEFGRRSSYFLELTVSDFSAEVRSSGDRLGDRVEMDILWKG